MPNRETSPHRTRPKRRVNLIGATSTIVGFVIGASIFILPGPVAGIVGPGLPLAYLLAVIPAIFACLYLVQLGSVLPVTGSNYVVATRFGSPLAGFSVVWMFIACAVFALPVMSIGFASYLETLLPGIDITITAIIVVVALGALNLFGIKAVTLVQSAMTGLFLVALIVFISGGLPNIDPGNFSSPFPNGITGLLLGVITVYFSFTGFTVIAEIAGEVKNARKTIPRALIISIVLILIVYVAVGAVVTGTLDWQGAGASPAAVADSASLYYPRQVVALISVGALFASATTINALFTSVVRDILRLGEDQVLPRWFARTSRRHNVPYPGVLVITGLVVVALLFNLDIEQYSMLTVFAILLLQCIAAFALFRVRKLKPNLWEASPIKFGRGLSLFTLVGLLLTSAFIVAFAAYSEPATAVVFFIVLLIGYVIWAVRSTILRRRGVSLAETTRQFDSTITKELGD